MSTQAELDRWNARVVERSTDQIERALLNVIAASHQTAIWIDLNTVIQTALARVAAEAAEVQEIIRKHHS